MKVILKLRIESFFMQNQLIFHGIRIYVMNKLITFSIPRKAGTTLKIRYVDFHDSPLTSNCLPLLLDILTHWWIIV